MYDYKIVEQVTRKKKNAFRSIKKDHGIFCRSVCGYGNYHIPGLYAGWFLPGRSLFIYGIFCQRDYEYIMENEQLTIDVIYGNKYRKTAHELDLRQLEVVAPHWHDSVAKYKKNGGTEHLKKYDYTSYEEDTPYYTMIIKEDGRKIKLLLDLTEEMLHTLKTRYPQKVFFA